jgi:hypothetical protein
VTAEFWTLPLWQIDSSFSQSQENVSCTVQFSSSSRPYASPCNTAQQGRFTYTMPFPCRFPAVPLPCRSAKGLDCVFPIWFTQCGRVWFTHTMPFPCHAAKMPFWKRPLKTTAGSRQENGMRTTWYVWISIGIRLLRLPRGVPERLLSEAYQSQMQVASVEQSNVCHGRGEVYCFCERTWVLL